MVFISLALYGCNSAKIAVSNNTSNEDSSKKQEENLYVNGIIMDDTAAVINDTVVDLYKDPDVKSERITQVLYNQPVKILEEKVSWLRVKAVDGCTGWIRSKFIDNDISSIYGRTFINKIIVTSKDKTIFSNPAGGVTQKVVALGTELYCFNTTGTAYEVYLPGNKTGWVRSSGIIQVGRKDRIPITTKEDFAASAIKFKGISYLLAGISSLGTDSMGMTYICARINGVDLPRSMKALCQYGKEMPLTDVDAGDLVFLSTTGDTKKIDSVGICTGNGQFIHASRTSGYVRLDGLNETGSDGKPVLARRIFP